MMKQFYRCAILITLLVMTIVVPASTQAYFTGDLGLGTTISLKDSDKLPQFKAHGFFSGQIEFSPDLLLRMGFSTKTEDIFTVLTDQSVQSELFVDTVNISYHHSTNKHNGYITLFFNEEDAIGSDIFLKRHFSVNSKPSHLTRTIQGTHAIKLYPMDGFGLSYAAVFRNSTAVGVYAYTDNESESLNFKTDLRIAGAWEYFAFDLALGGNADTDAEPTEKNLTLTVTDFSFRAGLTMIIGETQSTHAVINAGFLPGIVFPASDSIVSLDNMFFLLEPRFRVHNSYINLSAFLYPEEVLDSLFYIDKPIGLGITFEENASFNHPISGGFHIIAATETETVTDPSTFTLDALDLSLTPFATINTENGIVSFLLKVAPLKYEVVSELLALSIDFKIQL